MQEPAGMSFADQDKPALPMQIGLAELKFGRYVSEFRNERTDRGERRDGEVNSPLPNCRPACDRGRAKARPYNRRKGYPWLSPPLSSRTMPPTKFLASPKSIRALSR